MVSFGTLARKDVGAEFQLTKLTEYPKDSRLLFATEFIGVRSGEAVQRHIAILTAFEVTLAGRSPLVKISMRFGQGRPGSIS